MRARNGLYMPDGSFHSFAGVDVSQNQIATRATAALGMATFQGWLPNPDPVLKKLGMDIAVYREIRSDAHVGGCIRRRKAAVKAMERGLDPETPKSRLSNSIASWLNDLPLSRIISEMNEAVLYGYMPAEIIWGRVGSLTVPVDIVGKPPEWFGFGNDNQLLFKSKAKPMGEPVDPAKFVCARQDPTYLNPYGFPDLSMCYWPAIFKKAGFGFWMKFTEKYGMPWPVGKYSKGTSTDDIDKLLDALQAMIQDSVAAVPNDQSVEFLKTDASQSADAYNQFLMFCRSEVSIALLGQNQSTEANSTRASAQVGMEVTDDIRDGDSEIIAETFNTVIDLTCKQNWAGGQAPKFAFWEQEEIDDTRAKRDLTLSQTGAKLKKVYYQRAYGFADDEIEVAETPSPQNPADIPANFAGMDDFPDQAALDQAIDNLIQSGELQAEAEALLTPVFAALEGLESEAAIQKALVGAYPKMDDKALTKTLTRLYFAAELMGRLSAEEDLNNE